MKTTTKKLTFISFGQLLKSANSNLSVQLPFMDFSWRRPTVQHRTNSYRFR